MKNFKDTIIQSMRYESKKQVNMPEFSELLEFLHTFIPVTGRLDLMFCNSFLRESAQLLINSIFLYQDGYFDCAFYSVRQAGEVVNSMLFLANNPEKLKNWSAQEYFPVDSKLQIKLEKLSYNYKEIKLLLSDYFSHHKELIKKSHKIIHKQGFNTFYQLRKYSPEKCGFVQEAETSLFLDTLKYTIGIVLIVFIILEPLSLALADENISSKIHFNPMTESIDIDYFEKFLGLDDIIGKIKISEFYSDFISNFQDKEEMSRTIYNVIREEYWDTDALEEIEKQRELLKPYENFMLDILKAGIKVTNFYLCGGLCWYLTSIKSDFQRSTFGGEEFQNYLKTENKYNQSCANIFMSVVNMYNEPLFIEHNECLTNYEIKILKSLEDENKKQYSELLGIVENIFNSHQQ